MTTNRKRLTGKQEAFCINYFTTRNATDSAIQAGYSPLYAGQNADKIRKSTKVAQRIAELEAKVESEAIADVAERKKRLTEVLRANLTDFVDNEGNVTLKPSGALAEVIIEDFESVPGGRAHSRTKKVKLHSPLTAIEILNKMERIGADTLPSYQDNRQINIVVSSERAKELTENVARRLLPRQADEAIP